MNIPAVITTWGEIKEGNTVLVMRRSNVKVMSWATRIDRILEITPSKVSGILIIKAQKLEAVKDGKPEITYVVDAEERAILMEE